MQTFVAADGNTYPFSQIVRIRKQRREVAFVSTQPDGSQSKRESEVVTIDLMDGRTAEVETHVYNTWEFLPVTSFAAAPGTGIIHLDDEQPAGYFTTPVLGWAICADTGTYPVTIDGVNDGDSKAKPVLLPTGEVLYFGGIHASVDDWLYERKGKAKA